MKNNNRTKGKVVDCLPNAHFKVELEDGRIVRAYTAGKIRINKIRISIGDSVSLEIPSQGEIYRISFRL